MKSAGAFSTYRNANFLGHDRIVESWKWDSYVRPVICCARQLGGPSGTVRAGTSGAATMVMANFFLFRYQGQLGEAAVGESASVALASGRLTGLKVVDQLGSLADGQPLELFADVIPAFGVDIEVPPIDDGEDRPAL